MYVPRPSILQRPVREGGRANEEKADSEYAREQVRCMSRLHALPALLLLLPVLWACRQ